ncbi:hypothetical protein KFE25_014411 [Diacronema lutheri]|uniref:Protein kinase domain-containing protein n=1 Tax=Diacronema lutheri TaxID=2081491 RepID=A0A8J6C9W7_DIALT|nr:hypothetical protein KFE25_014411 [Diacronema lutheri]
MLDFMKKSPLAKNYEVGKHLGSGNFAEVHQCKRKADGLECAVKIIDKAKAGTLEAIQDEVAIMERIDHKNVVKLYEVFDESAKINLVMELVTGGELFDRIVARGSYTEADAAECVRQICDALAYMHANDICHRDLKPENILYASPADDAAIKLADFGLAKVVSEKAIMQTACGTPGYVAPEILQNTGFGIEVDMWSVGVILYILLCGFPPFYEEELPRLFATIMAGRYDFPSPWWDTVSADAKDLVNKLLVVDPKKRLTAEQVLKHPWIVSSAPAEAQLTEAVKSLKKYNAHRKLKKVTLGVIFNNKLGRK